MTKIYLSGKITGTSDYESRFAEAQKKMEEKGYEVLNPVKCGKWLERQLAPQAPTWIQYMKQAISAMMKADCIYMLKGYKDSKGARVELFLAKILQYKIFYEGEK